MLRAYIFFAGAGAGAAAAACLVLDLGAAVAGADFFGAALAAGFDFLAGAFFACDVKDELGRMVLEPLKTRGCSIGHWSKPELLLSWPGSSSWAPV